MYSENILSLLIRYSNNHLNLPVLCYACLIGDKEAVELLIDNGISATKEALNHAIKSGNTEILEFLIQQGVRPDSGHLTIAVEHNNCEAIHTLLNNGADIYDGDDPSSFHGQSALECAAMKGNLEAIQVFIDHGYDIDEWYAPWGTTVMTEVIKEHANGTIKAEIAIRSISYLLDRGADIDLPAQTYGTPLAAAFGGPHSHLDLIALLVYRGAEVTRAVVVSALERGANRACLELLLSSGIDIHGAPILALTACTDVKELLIKHGAVNPITI